MLWRTVRKPVHVAPFRRCHELVPWAPGYELFPAPAQLPLLVFKMAVRTGHCLAARPQRTHPRNASPPEATASFRRPMSLCPCASVLRPLHAQLGLRLKPSPRPGLAKRQPLGHGHCDAATLLFLIQRLTLDGHRAQREDAAERSRHV